MNLFSEGKMKKTAYSLIELLCVIGIVLILASLLLVVVLKAKRYAQHKTFQIVAYDSFDRIQEQLGRYYENKTNFPAFTAFQLSQKGVFDLHTMDFLNNPEVTFNPFSSTDADSAVILRVVVRSNEILFLTKSNAVHPPQ